MGCLLGCALGDSIGLPLEGLSPGRIAKLRPTRLKQSFALGYGMLSDDTDHSIFVAQALLQSEGDVRRFRTKLRWKLKLWLVSLPAGIGLGTLRSIVRMWLGFANPGVHSAGNGAAMRSAILGAALANQPQRRHEMVAASSTLTHVNSSAMAGAAAVAEIAAKLASGEWPCAPALDQLQQLLESVSSDPKWSEVVPHVIACCQSPDPIASARFKFGDTSNGVSGYVLHSVPFAIVAWHSCFGDLRRCIESVVLAGGDTDTNAAIAGALVGLNAGTSLPQDWLDRLKDWPHSLPYLRQLALALTGSGVRCNARFSLWLFPRNLMFTAWVLLHGARRLLPPY